MIEEQKSPKVLHYNKSFYLEKLKEKIRNHRIRISNLKKQYKSIDNDKKVICWRAIEDLDEKIFWLSEDTKSYEILGEKGWEGFREEIEKDLKIFEENYHKVLAIFF